MRLSKPEIDIIGYCAAAMTTTALIPQLTRVIKTHSAGDISLGMFSIYTTGVTCWLTFGLLSRTWPVMIANSISLVLASSILVCKLRFDHKGGAEGKEQRS